MTRYERQPAVGLYVMVRTASGEMRPAVTCNPSLNHMGIEYADGSMSNVGDDGRTVEGYDVFPFEDMEHEWLLERARKVIGSVPLPTLREAVREMEEMQVPPDPRVWAEHKTHWYRR